MHSAPSATGYCSPPRTDVMRWVLKPSQCMRPDVARVLDLDAAVHHHRQPARLGDARAFLVDHAELAPEGAGADLHRFGGDRRQRVGRAEDVDDVDRHRARRARLLKLFSPRISDSRGLTGMTR